MPADRPLARQLIGLAVWLVLCFAVGAFGAVGSSSAPTFYAQLARPEWAPPATLFAPVWSTLYALMAVAAWLVWRRGPSSQVTAALIVFVVQLVVNGVWSWIYFKWQDGAMAFAEVVLLWLLIVVTIVLFVRVSRLAAVLLLPYLAWVTFAAALTWSTWQRNPQLL